MKYYSKYEVALAILKKLNPDIETTPKNNYEVALAVLEAIKNGGGTSEPLYLYLYANNSTSTFNWNGSKIPNVEYSLDGGKTYQLITDTNSISLPEKTKVYLRGQNLSGFTNSSSYFNIKGVVGVGGDLGSVINGIDPTATVNSYNFSYFFRQSRYIQNDGDGVTEFYKDFHIPVSENLNLVGFFFGNKVLMEIPLIDTTECRSFEYMFNGCTKLTTIPLIDTSKGTDFSDMFDGCTNLTTIPLIDTSKGTDFSYMFNNCTNLTTIPAINTSNCTDFNYMFNGCTKLTTIPLIDTSKCKRFSDMFNNCTNLTSIPQLNTSKGTIFYRMFYGCTNLTTTPTLDLSLATSNSNLNNMFYKCSKLENITFTGSINANLDFSSSPLLTFDSVKSILTAASNTTNTNSKTLTFNRSITDVDGELAALVATCTSKGWTISGLTLE
jgi:hypothetical protein